MKYFTYLLITICICCCITLVMILTKDTKSKQETNNCFTYIKEFTYKEHDYIKFREGPRCGVVHNPDCKKCKSLQYQITDTVLYRYK